MIVISSKTDTPIRITDERLNHVITAHPEMEGEENKIIETLENPDLILKGDFDELLAVRHYEKTPVEENKYLVVIYKEIENIDGFLITAYFTRQYSKRRKIIWKS